MPAQGPVKLLVVDDRAENRLALEALLRHRDYEIVSAGSGAEALRFLLRDDCAAILMDVQMPDMDGFETARLVRENARTRFIPIVFLTANRSDGTYVARGYQAGAIDYLVKPVEPDILRAKVAALVEIDRAKRQAIEEADRRREEERQQRLQAIADLERVEGEKERLELAQGLMRKLVDDLTCEKKKVDAANRELRRDNEERAAAEEALRDRTRALAASNADLEQFAYVASHDLQEPLRMISSYMQLFEKKYRGALDVQSDKYIQYAVEGANRMQALIAGLLEYSRMGRQQEPLAAVDTGSALDQALKNLRAAIEESRAEITRGPLPRIIGHASQIMRVFQNLVGNAIKFRRPGEPPRVEIAAELRGKLATFSVRDDGIGIDPQHAERVFVIFQRLHTRAEYPGTGLGLSICKKVIENHGGRLWLQSAPGAGTTFFFTLPVVPERT